MTTKKTRAADTRGTGSGRSVDRTTTRGKGRGSKRSVGSLTHVDASGAAKMVDVSEKPVTERTAVAKGVVRIGPKAARAVRANAVAKGNVLEVAKLAGIMGAKRTYELIPLCHPLPLDHVSVDVRLVRTEIHLEATAVVAGRTGVEMEALTAVSVAALTVYDMLKAVEKGIEIGPIHLTRKTGGARGDYVRS